MANNCPICMANMDMVGKSHRCIAREPTPSPTLATYKYRDAEKRREYMRGYMKKKREKDSI